MSPRDPPQRDSPQQDPGEHDPAEIWGRRIGRFLGVVALAVMAYWLGQQLRLW